MPNITSLNAKSIFRPKISNDDPKVQMAKKMSNEMRKKLYEAQDDVDARKEQLIARVEAQLKQRTSLAPLFTIRWKVM